MRLFVDTCVWWHWLTLKNNKPFKNHVSQNHAEDFDQIYEIVSSERSKHVFLYNALIEGEFRDCYLNGLPWSFSEISDIHHFEKTPIPLSRCDGTYKADGSILAGGRFGGSLRGILSIDGYDHEKALQKATPNYKRPGNNPVHTKPRKREFDVEHLESALEASADLFITSDQPLIKRLRHASEILKDNLAVTRANEICVTPGQALSRLD